MNSAYVPLTVHDYPRRANLYVNFAQTVNHDPPPNLQHPNERMCVEIILAAHLRPALHSAFPYMRSRLVLNHVRHTSEQCIYTTDWLHAHAKYSSDALPVKQITFPARRETKTRAMVVGGRA